MHKRFESENVNGEDHLVDKRVDERITLEWSLNKHDMTALLRIETFGRTILNAVFHFRVPQRAGNVLTV
jgi:hypothetical protein